MRAEAVPSLTHRRGTESLWSSAKPQTLQLRANVSYSVLAPLGGPDSIPKEREPVPDERYRNHDVIEDVEAGDWLDGDCHHPRCQCRPDPVAECSEYALSGLSLGSIDITTMSTMHSANITAMKMSRSRTSSTIAFLRDLPSLAPFGIGAQRLINAR